MTSLHQRQDAETARIEVTKRLLTGDYWAIFVADHKGLSYCYTLIDAFVPEDDEEAHMMGMMPFGALLLIHKQHVPATMLRATLTVSGYNEGLVDPPPDLGPKDVHVIALNAPTKNLMAFNAWMQPARFELTGDPPDDDPARPDPFVC